MKANQLSPLAAAAEALDAELGRYEALAAGIARDRLDSEKSLRRAVHTLGELQSSEARLGTHLEALAVALADVRRRQQDHAETVRQRAEEVGQRMDRLTALLGRWQALGDGAREINRLVQTFAAPPAADEPGAAAFAQLDGQLGRLADDADALVRLAESDGFGDLGRQAEGLRVQLLSVRNKFKLMQERG